MVKASPASSLVMAESEFLLEFLVVALDPPAQLGEIDELVEWNVLRQRGEPVFGRLFLVFRPFDQQPLFGSAFLEPKRDRKSTRLNSSHTVISYAVFCL